MMCCSLQNGAEPAADAAATRPYRRIYVGGLPEGISQSELTEVGGVVGWGGQSALLAPLISPDRVAAAVVCLGLSLGNGNIAMAGDSCCSLVGSKWTDRPQLWGPLLTLLAQLSCLRTQLAKPLVPWRPSVHGPGIDVAGRLYCRPACSLLSPPWRQPRRWHPAPAPPVPWSAPAS